MKRPILLLPLLILVGLVCVSPASAGLFDLSDSRERKVGEDMMRQLKERYPYYADWEISGIGELLRNACEAPEWVVDFHVFPDPEINAFALPGGHLMITEGLLEILQTQDEVAFVLAHEMGHAVKRHIASQYKRANENNLLFSVILAALGANRTMWDLSNLGQSVALNQYSQKKEREADLVGYQLAAKVGYNPEAAISALEKLRQDKGEDSKTMNKLFGTHPLITERVHRLDVEPGERALERPVIEPPLDVLSRTKLQLDYLNTDDRPWTDEWAVAIAHRVNLGLVDLPDLSLVHKWQLRRSVDRPDFKAVVHRRLVQKGKHQDATLEMDLFDAHSGSSVWNKRYATRSVSDMARRVNSFADEVSADLGKFLKAARK
jgi:Zn-dependent protease with chaperone function